jgi:hypothetical protein
MKKIYYKKQVFIRSSSGLHQVFMGMGLPITPLENNRPF